MSTDLTTIDPVADVTEEMHLIARSPNEMAEAQRRLSAWCDGKIAILEKDAAELGQAVEVAMQNNWNSTTLKRHERIASNRVEFYRKVKAAVEAGYCIVPNFPVDVFAIRTIDDKPKPKQTSYPSTHTQEGKPIPQGEGEYVDSSPQEWQRTISKTDSQGNLVVDQKTGKALTEKIYWAKEFRDEIDFPISVARPAIMSATSEAMALKVFDELGVLPNRRAKGDPIVVGRIIDPRSTTYSRRFVTFMVAWYVDTRQL